MTIPFSELSEKARISASELMYTSIPLDKTMYLDLLAVVAKAYTSYIATVVTTDESINFLFNVEQEEGTFTASNFKLNFVFNSYTNSIDFGIPQEATFHGTVPLESFEEELNLCNKYGLVTKSLAGYLNSIIFDLYSLTKVAHFEGSYSVCKAKHIFANYFTHYNSLKYNEKDFTKVYMFETRFLAAVEKCVTDAFSRVAYEIFETVSGLEMALEDMEDFVDYIEALNNGGIQIDSIAHVLLGDTFQGFDENGSLLFEAKNPKPTYEDGIKVVKDMCNQAYWRGRDCSLSELIELVALLRNYLKHYTNKYSQVCELEKKPEHESLFILLYKLENFVVTEYLIDECLTAWHDLYDAMVEYRKSYFKKND